MLNRREGFRSISLLLGNLYCRHSSGIMALCRPTADLCDLSQFSKANGRYTMKRRFFVDMGVFSGGVGCGTALSSNSRANGHYTMKKRFFVDVGVFNAGVGCRTALSLKSCLDRLDNSFRRGDEDMQKARAVAARHRQLVRDSGFFLAEDVGANLVVGDETRNNGNSILYTDRSLPSKLVVAVDVDEVLGSFLSALNKFIADRYSANHSVSEYYVYEFFKIWNCSRAEADIRVHEFFKTSYFKTGIHPIPGARHVLHRLSAFCDLSVVTSRQNAIKDHTLNWLEQNYPGLFQEIHFGNHFALDGKSRPKSEICRTLGAQVLIDDNPRYALECAEVGIKVLLFDYHNTYPWCKTGAAESHPLVTKVHNWQEVEHQLVSLVSP